jgi:putative tryptophan/tyrosine transport system substrate-binding protein
VRRRDFITLLGGTAAAWPLAAPAQQPLRRIAMLLINAEGDPEVQPYVMAFRQGLLELGWTEGRNIQIDYLWGARNPDRARALAAQLVTQAPDVVLAYASAATAAVQLATSIIPVVFVVVADPVGSGFVQSLARPGGNITGFGTFEPAMGGKWLALLKEVAPSLRRVACISDPSFKAWAEIFRATENAAPNFQVEVTSVHLHDSTDDIESPVAAFAQEPNGGLIIIPTLPNYVYRERILSLATRHRLPACYPFRTYATEGGLMSYGPDQTDLFRRSASYVDRILKGAKPSELPVQHPIKFDLAVNLRAAKTLGLEFPPTLLARADEVID